MNQRSAALLYFTTAQTRFHFSYNNKHWHPVVTDWAWKKNSHLSHLSISSCARLRDGWHSLPHCLQSQWFLFAEFARKHTDQTRWRGRPCYRHPPSLTPVAPLTALHLSTVSADSCDQPAAWGPLRSGWHSSRGFWTGRRNKKQCKHDHTSMQWTSKTLLSVCEKTFN